MTITANIQTQALDVLDGTSEVVRNEMIRRGVYVSNEIVKPELKEAGSICGGREACAIGAAYLGARVRMLRDFDGDLVMPGVEQDKRTEFLRNRPALRTAIEALNAEADAYIERNDLERHINRGLYYRDSIEALFEAKHRYHQRPLVRRDALLRIIERAKVRVSELETR